MYEFFDRLVATALPRIRDFRGLSPRKFDGRGQLHVRRLGPDHFPGDRTGQDQTEQGMDITIVTSARDNARRWIC
jgi:large subunit ribosomal protein L5